MATSAERKTSGLETLIQTLASSDAPGDRLLARLIATRPAEEPVSAESPPTELGLSRAEKMRRLSAILARSPQENDRRLGAALADFDRLARLCEEATSRLRTIASSSVAVPASHPVPEDVHLELEGRCDADSARWVVRPVRVTFRLADKKHDIALAVRAEPSEPEAPATKPVKKKTRRPAAKVDAPLRLVEAIEVDEDSAATPIVEEALIQTEMPPLPEAEPAASEDLIAIDGEVAIEPVETAEMESAEAPAAEASASSYEPIDEVAAVEEAIAEVSENESELVTEFEQPVEATTEAPEHEAEAPATVESVEPESEAPLTIEDPAAEIEPVIEEPVADISSTSEELEPIAEIASVAEPLEPVVVGLATADEPELSVENDVLGQAPEVMAEEPDASSLIDATAAELMEPAADPSVLLAELEESATTIMIDGRPASETTAETPAEEPIEDIDALIARIASGEEAEVAFEAEEPEETAEAESGIDLADLQTAEPAYDRPEPDVLARLPRRIAFMALALPVRMEDGALVCMVASADDQTTIDNLATISGAPIRAIETDREELLARLKAAYGEEEGDEERDALLDQLDDVPTPKRGGLLSKLLRRGGKAA